MGRVKRPGQLVAASALAETATGPVDQHTAGQPRRRPCGLYGLAGNISTTRSRSGSAGTQARSLAPPRPSTCCAAIPGIVVLSNSRFRSRAEPSPSLPRPGTLESSPRYFPLINPALENNPCAGPIPAVVMALLNPCRRGRARLQRPAMPMLFRSDAVVAESPGGSCCCSLASPSTFCAHPPHGEQLQLSAKGENAWGFQHRCPSPRRRWAGVRVRSTISTPKWPGAVRAELTGLQASMRSGPSGR